MLFERHTTLVRRLCLAVLVLAVAAGCSSVPRANSPITLSASATGTEEETTEESGKKERSLLVSVLLYLPNRILDLFDIARFGVDVGPGVGVQAQVTEAVQAKAKAVIGVGVGYQTLRHLPIQASTEAAAAVGPLGSEVGTPLPWYRSKSDVRLGLHLVAAGAHVAIDPKEWLDIPLGFVGIDIVKDDL